ncbi:type II toxin-antitoxin system VapC family toxin [Muricoccus radiodurans]|uniref:type II toxin-antitoxin system VapC family toxin n=1 Tax=Muricoccus radiodurans TaxID=2231721 RepID=UPI003CF246DD
MTDPSRLPRPVVAALSTPENTLLVSAASVWEIAIKAALGRLRFPLDRIDAVLERAGMEPLPIRAAHAVAAGALPRHHGDPFDRMLIAQAQVEDLVLVSTDAAMAAYPMRLFGRDAG